MLTSVKVVTILAVTFGTTESTSRKTFTVEFETLRLVALALLWESHRGLFKTLRHLF